MKLSEMIREMQNLAAYSDGDPEVILFDTETEREYALRPDEDRFDYQIMRGDNQIVLEF